MTNITLTPVWKDLQQHQKATVHIQMRDQFSADPNRFDSMHEKLGNLLFDYSKNRISEETLTLLCKLADTAQVQQKADAMRRGEKINLSENRAVLHTALRLPENAEPVYVDGENVLPKIHHELNRALQFAEKLNNGTHLGSTGQRITDFVHIGIGGSDLGPQIVAQALYPHRQNIRVHFVSNADDANITQTLESLNPETTVFCIASKSFCTPETLLNAQTARNWFLQHGRQPSDIPHHFVAISSNIKAVQDFGIAADNIFAMFNWVGGRYSVWSAIGLPAMVAVGAQNFREFLNGAHAMDQHFFTAPYRHNIPVLHALIGIWYNNFYGAGSHTVVPYSHNLRRFSAYLQQLDMESNGKHRMLSGETASCATGPIIFGEEGVNCQHAYFQLLHQGTRLIPTDFIVPMRTPYHNDDHHRFVAANAFGQAEAFMRGKTLAEAEVELSHLPESQRKLLAPQKEFLGNQPSNSIVFDELTPFNLGMLVALYEHKVFVQGAIWNINSFDQWGVEYGKVLAKSIGSELSDANAKPQHDSSTNGLINFYHQCRNSMK